MFTRWPGLITVVVSTYNWPAALQLVLYALSHQTDQNFEVVCGSNN